MTRTMTFFNVFYFLEILFEVVRSFLISTSSKNLAAEKSLKYANSESKYLTKMKRKAQKLLNEHYRNFAILTNSVNKLDC